MARTGQVTAIAFALTLASSTGVALAQPDDGGEIEMGDAAPADAAPPAEAPALDPETAKANARKLLDGGDGFLKRGDYYAKKRKPNDATAQYERALAAYTKAYELVPNPKILFPIAIAEQKLGRWALAARDFRKFLNQVPEGDAKMRADATTRLEAVKAKVGVLAIVVNAEEAEVSLDGTVIGTAPLVEPLFLPAGEYTLSFTANGYQPLEQQVSIEDGSESERTFELTPIPIIVEPPTRRPIEEPPAVVRVPGPSKLPLIALGGLALGLAGGATATGLIAVGRHATFTDESVGDNRREDARVSGKKLALLTDGLIVGSVVATGVFTYYYLKVYRPKAKARSVKEREQRSPGDAFASAPKILVTPWVEASVGGLVLSGSL